MDLFEPHISAFPGSPPKPLLQSNGVATIAHVLVQTPAHLAEVVPTLAEAKVLAVDTETTSLDPLLGKVRLIQVAIAHHPVVVVDLFAIPMEAREPLKALLQQPSIKVAHNWKFDWKFLHQAGLTPNGILFDTMLSSQLLAAGNSGKHTLKDLAKRYLDIELDKELQTSQWNGILDPQQIAYAARDAAILLPLRDILRERLMAAHMVQVATLEFHAIPAVAQMELDGMLLHLQQWNQLGAELEAERSRLDESLQHLLRSGTLQGSLLPEFDRINPDSSQQVLAALKAQGIPLRRTSKWALKPLANDYPVIQTLLEYRKVSKAISAFGTALPRHVHPTTGRLHPTYWQIGTTTGRFSCSDPNLQQIPRNQGMRRCFVPAPQHKLVIADYSQVELRIVAEMSGDERMITAYQQGDDLHQLTASLVAHKAMHTVTKSERQAAKAINFGLIYAMSAAGLKSYAKNTYGVEMSDEEAQTFCRRFFEAYQGIANWHERVRKELYTQDTWTTRTLSNRLRFWRDKPTLPEVLNTPVQGTSADITKQALAMLPAALQGTDTKIIGTVHDEILLECPASVGDAVASILADTMAAAGGVFVHQVPIIADVKVADSWADK